VYRRGIRVLAEETDDNANSLSRYLSVVCACRLPVPPPLTRKKARECSTVLYPCAEGGRRVPDKQAQGGQIKEGFLINKETF